MALIKEAVIRASKSLLTPEFRRGYNKLGPQFQTIVQLKYARWRATPDSLNFEPKFYKIYVVEVTSAIHAICEVQGTIVRWLWIGNYKDYTSKLDLLRRK